MTRIWPFNSFWMRHQYAQRHIADLPNLPHELNAYERFVVRWAFAEGKVLLLVPVGALLGWGLAAMSHGRILP